MFETDVLNVPGIKAVSIFAKHTELAQELDIRKLIMVGMRYQV